MTEILTESYCERCGNRFTFESATRTPGPFSRARTLAHGLRNYLTSDESLDEALAEARRDRERRASGLQLQAFHDTFSFCFTCRQYTCRDCWNEAAGKCRSCAPMLGVPDPLEIRELQAAEAAQAAVRAAQAAVADASTPIRIRTVDVQAWPAADVGPAWTEPASDTLTVSRRGDLPPAAETAPAGGPAEAQVPPGVAAEPVAEMAGVAAAEAAAAAPDGAEVGSGGTAVGAGDEVTPEFVATELERLMAEAEAQLAGTEREPATAEANAVAEAETEAAATPSETAVGPEAPEAVAAEAAAERVAAEAIESRQAPETEIAVIATEAEPSVAPEEPVAEAAVAPEPVAAEPTAVESIAAEPATLEPLTEPAPVAEPAPMEMPAVAAVRTPEVAPPAPPSPSQPEPASPFTAPWRIVAPDETPQALPPTAWPSAPPGRARGAGQQVPTPASPLGWLLRSRDSQPQVSPRITRSVWDESSREIVARPGSGIQACQQCSLPLSASARFCRRCGARQG